jgi:hypothetical protein
VDERGWPAFVQACLMRNPVSLELFQGKNPDAVHQLLAAYPTVSVYDQGRLATPDEVVNFGRGNGAEKALALANLLRQQQPLGPGSLVRGASGWNLYWGKATYDFPDSQADQTLPGRAEWALQGDEMNL